MQTLVLLKVVRDINNKKTSLIGPYFKRIDLFLLIMCLICAAYGLVVINSATLTYESSRYITVQSLSIVIGVIAFLIISVIDVGSLADKWQILLGFSILFMLVLIPFGTESDTGNSGWLRFFGIGIQPSEIVKLTFILCLAKQIVHLKEYKDLNSVFSVFQLALHFILIFGLVLICASDLGSALAFFFIFAVMLFAAGFKLYWFAIGFAAIAAVMPFIWTYALADYQKLRILAPYVPSVDPTGYGVSWQANQSKLALASGRLTGTGLGQGTQSQSDAIFAKESDFIFAVVGEELGMIGCLAVIILLTIVILRCVYIGLKSTDQTSTLVCFGIAGMMAFQTFENIGMCIGVAPVIGITLPFFSYGGSSIVSMFMAMGLISSVRYREKSKKQGSFF